MPQISRYCDRAYFMSVRVINSGEAKGENRSLF